ncbi:MAG: dihydroorotate dehydrogenase electron transfer subunit [Rhizobacter sp.]|nr:dihydroorotate dehydrogenase electron transfer subunit [Chlorobiales bacterium]
MTMQPLYDLPLTVVENIRLTSVTNVLVLDAPVIAPVIRSGQFVNVKVNGFHQPLLRRPLSVHRVVGSQIEIMIRIVGIGTQILYDAPVGTALQTLAPLGNTFGYNRDDFDTALLVSGGIGVAPMAMLEETLLKRGKKVVNFIGARSAPDVITRGLTNIHAATDDGSLGFKGNIVRLLAEELPQFNGERLRVFSCGPNRMLESLAQFCNERGLPCEVSIESIMGCGIGICYGCPVRVRGEDGLAHNQLLCQYGSVIDAKEIMFEV